MSKEQVKENQNNVWADDDFEELDEVQTSQEMVKYTLQDKERTDRIGFPLLTKNGKIALRKVAFFNYDDGVVFRKFLPPQDEDLYTEAKIKCGEPKVRWVTIIIKYGTTKDGKPTKPFTYELMPIVLDNKKVNALKKLAQTQNLGEIDVLVSTNNPKYHELDFSPTKKAIWRSGKLVNNSDFDEDDIDNDDLSSDVEYVTPEQIMAEAREMAKEMWKAIVPYEMSDKEIRSLLKGEITAAKQAEGDDEEEEVDDNTEDLDTKKEKAKKVAKQNKVSEPDDDFDDEDDF